MKLIFTFLLLISSLFSLGQTNYFSTTIGSNSDDAEENISGGGIDLTSSDLEMVHDNGVLGVGSKDQWIGLRFTNIDIPKNAIIDSVFIQFTVKSSDNDPAILQFYGEKFFNSPTFSDLDFNISSRPRTDTSVYWTVENWNDEDESGPKQTTPNLAGLLSEVITQSLWQQGNSASFIVEGSGRRSAFSHDNDSQKAARLHVYYRENTAQLESFLAEQAPSIYPNPSNGSFHIDLSGYSSGEAIEITLISPMGAILYDARLSGGDTHTINEQINNFKGLMFIKISTEGSTITHRQIVK